MTQLVPATAQLGPGKTGLAIGYRVLDIDRVQYSAFTTANVVETNVAGTFSVVGGVVAPNTGGNIVWGVSGTDYGESPIESSVINSVSGSVGSVTGLTPATVADAVMDELLSGHTVAGSAGAVLGLLAGIDTSAVTVTSSNNAGVLTFTKGVTFAATVSGLTISATWAKLFFTLKESDYDTDDMALIQLVETNPGAGTDGLLYLDGAAIASPVTLADGTLTVSQVAGTVAIAITDNATVLLSKASELVWDIKTKDAAGATVQNATGTASITQSVTQTI